jgi:two-component system response regulator AtoC
MPTRRVLVLDDERLVRWSLVERLRRDAIEAVEAGSVAEALEQAARGVDGAILDYRLPDGDGLAVLKSLRQADPDLPAIMLTAHTDVPVIVAAVRAGASDYVAKPFDVDDVALRLARALEATESYRELRRLKEDLAKPFSFASMIGDSMPMQQIKLLASKVAQSPASTVLLTGESGTGKDLLAKVIHYGSRRAAKPFMNITCSALPEHLLESELFGHERGAFTDARQQRKGLFEQADGGTVFLDEIGEIVPALQAKLLRFLEDKTFRRLGGSSDITVDVRIIAATNRDLEEQVRTGGFREDLFYRLNVLRVEMPPLRDRGDDTVLLAEHFARQFSREFRRPIRGLTDDARQVLTRYHWPGNVRELRNVVERAVLLTESADLDAHDFEGLRMQRPAAASDKVAGSVPGGLTLPEEGLRLDDVERELIMLALERTHGNQTRAASLLGLHRDQIRYRMEKYGLLKPTSH